ncbi:hypothetical protein GCM10009549_57650 [Streptomyces thermoalcalitolerans]|uniref:Uncharacterized protein n=1 Tax=Streptomyces thermoalcalitolerans TaxID=65605 RepID=A0ABP4ABW8_9ACTN
MQAKSRAQTRSSIRQEPKQRGRPGPVRARAATGTDGISPHGRDGRAVPRPWRGVPFRRTGTRGAYDVARAECTRTPAP